MEAHLNPKPSPPPGYVEPTDDLLAADNARADAKRATTYRTATDPAEIRAVLDRLPVGAKANVKWFGIYDDECVSTRDSAEGGNYLRESGGRRGYSKSMEWGDNCSVTYRLADDPQATPAKETTPSPKPLPFGCVAREREGKWQVENAAGTHWWSDGCEWDTSQISRGWARTRDEALSDFDSTNGGKFPPPDHKPASEGRYSVEAIDMASVWYVMRKGTPNTVAASIPWSSNGGKEESYPIALAVRDALEARNA